MHREIHCAAKVGNAAVQALYTQVLVQTHHFSNKSHKTNQLARRMDPNGLTNSPMQAAAGGAAVYNLTGALSPAHVDCPATAPACQLQSGCSTPAAPRSVGSPVRRCVAAGRHWLMQR